MMKASHRLRPLAMTATLRARKGTARSRCSFAEGAGLSNGESPPPPFAAFFPPVGAMRLEGALSRTAGGAPSGGGTAGSPGG
eukprot:4420775-Prymnesium_polylepis.1